MPISMTDDQGNELDLTKADGGTLRKKLEETLEYARSLEKDLVTTKAERALSEHGRGLVTIEDLKGVAPHEVEDRVKALAEQKLEERKGVIRDILREREGVDGEELDALVEDFLGGRDEPAGEPEPDLTEVSKLPGDRPGLQPKMPGMDDAMGNLESFFVDQEKRHKRRK